MKNRRNIVELKYPPENPNDIWLKDGKFYRSTSEGWIVIDSKTEYTSKESMIADNPKGGTIGIDKETGEASIYNDVAEQWSPLSGGGVTSITWQELKDKRDNRQLIPGSLYRITDYQCTTTQENTRSAGHQFDIVLLALSEDKLAEEGWAMMHENVYDVTFDDGVTKKCWYFNSEVEGICIIDYNTLLGIDGLGDIEINEEIKTITNTGSDSTELTIPNLPYNYFQNSNLSAWKVWYCLDNDKSRFAWADDSVDEGSPAKIITDNGYGRFELFRNSSFDRPNNIYGWAPIPYSEDSECFTTSETPSIGDHTVNIEGNEMSDVTITSYTPAHEGTGLPNGRGVIYRLIDEWNNDVPYDFKNILISMNDKYNFTFLAINDNDELVDASLGLSPNAIDNVVARFVDFEEEPHNQIINMVVIDCIDDHACGMIISCKAPRDIVAKQAQLVGYSFYEE